MKKQFATLLLTIFISSTLTAQSLYESAWVNKEKEMTLLTILKKNGEFWMNFSNKSFQISDDKNPSITLQGKTITIDIDTDAGTLALKDKVFIPEFKSRKYRFSGRWKSKEDGTEFNIHQINGGLVWDIIDEEGKSVRFYPKLIEDGLTFTIGHEQLYFKINDEVLIDNTGKRYINVGS